MKRFLSVAWAGALLISALLGAAPAVAGEARWAVAADGTDPMAPVSEVAARAPYLLVFDAQGVFLEALENPAVRFEHRAGPALAELLEELKVDVLIAGEIGRNLATALEEKKIRSVIASGPAAQAVKDALQ
jgi:predicted Fe-Mo cluster-binding NifX family protein